MTEKTNALTPEGLPPLPKNLTSASGPFWKAVHDWHIAKVGPETAKAVENLENVITDLMQSYARKTLRTQMREVALQILQNEREDVQAWAKNIAITEKGGDWVVSVQSQVETDHKNTIATDVSYLKLERGEIIDLISPLSNNTADHDIEFAYRVIAAICLTLAARLRCGWVGEYLANVDEYGGVRWIGVRPPHGTKLYASAPPAHVPADVEAMDKLTQTITFDDESECTIEVFGTEKNLTRLKVWLERCDTANAALETTNSSEVPVSPRNGKLPRGIEVEATATPGFVSIAGNVYSVKPLPIDSSPQAKSSSVAEQDKLLVALPRWAASLREYLTSDFPENPPRLAIAGAATFMEEVAADLNRQIKEQQT